MNHTSRSDRDELLGDLERARNELCTGCQGLSEEQMTRLGAVGEWSVKDVLSHVASWDEAMLPDLARIARGERPALASIDLERADFDNANAAIMSQRRNLPLAQVLRELDKDRGDVIVAIGRLPDSALAEGQFGRILLQVTIAHDREHASGIAEWRRRQAP